MTKRRIKFECTGCGAKGENSHRKVYPADAVKLQLTCCAECRQAGDCGPSITFFDVDGDEIDSTV